MNSEEQKILLNMIEDVIKRNNFDAGYSCAIRLQYASFVYMLQYLCEKKTSLTVGT